MLLVLSLPRTQAMASLESLVETQYADVLAFAAELEAFREMYNYCTSWSKAMYKLKPQKPGDTRPQWRVAW